MPGSQSPGVPTVRAEHVEWSGREATDGPVEIPGLPLDWWFSASPWSGLRHYTSPNAMSAMITKRTTSIDPTGFAPGCPAPIAVVA